MKNRRSEFEIISKILDLSKYGAKKTEILYKGNFSHTQLTGYLNYLVNKKILEEKFKEDDGQNNKYYIITEKGIDLLADINKTISHLQD